MQNNLVGVIDIGSNSVRLLIADGTKTVDKSVKITKLAEGTDNGALKKESIERTVDALSFFKEKAEEYGVKTIYAFATEAVRSATNKEDFLKLAERKTGLIIEVVSGDTEARLGIKGALNGKDGAIIDIGGASTEITVIKKGETIYTKSVGIGVVRIENFCGQDEIKQREYIDGKIKEFGDIPYSTFIGIGGTATSVASVLQELEPYDRNKVHGYTVYKSDLKKLRDELYKKTVEEKKKVKGLQKERAGTITGGVALLYKLMEKLKIDSITVSESDNLEGYLLEKRG
ncbi:MAG: Ppx/GppA family phosphatase [Clostridia bacterium]|nr:Ppx/GppA family phosphatase [Clostridia bacterium]